jgi:hypothetical protein
MAWSVKRSSIALQSRALGILVVHSEKGKFVVTITAACSARPAMIWKSNSAAASGMTTYRVNLAATARDWEHRFPQHGGSNRVSREAGQETLHLVESMASFSLRFGCGSGTGCGELGRLFFGVGGMSAFIESAIRFDFASALSTLTFTICPGLTASEGSLMKRFESSLMCISAMT